MQPEWPFLYFQCSFGTCKSFDIKTFPERDKKTLLLTEKKCVPIPGSIKPCWLLYSDYHELHCGFNAYKKNYFVSSFK